MAKLNCSYFLSSILSKEIYILISFIFLIGVQYYFYFVDKVTGWSRVGLALIFIGGGLNLLERLSFGCVKDYLNFFNIFYYNIFDILITSGLIIFGAFYFIKDGK